MTGTGIILDKITILGLLTLIGIIYYRLKWLGPEVKQGLHKLIFNLTLPLLIFNTVSRFEFTGELIGNGLLVFGLTYFFLAIQYLMGWASARIFKLPPRKGIVHVLHTVFGNVVFLGYPLIDALFPGTPALFYAASYHLAQTSVIWTLGVYQLSGSRSVGFFSNLKKLVNPNTIAFAAGIVFMLWNINLPASVEDTFRGLGGSTLYISMIYIGMLIAEFSPKRSDLGWDNFAMILNKLILAPLVITAILWLLTGYAGMEMSLPATGALVMQTAMPCMAIMVILARNYGADEKSAMVNVFFTTVLSLVTLPVMFWVLMRVFGN